MDVVGLSGDKRFPFGKNWSRFLKHLDESRLADARASLTRMLEYENMDGKSFVDVGSGSGLFSLAARSLGATVYSFDYDIESVRCTEQLKRIYFPDDERWKIEQGSILDDRYVRSLGRFDVVYSWGVLHHTGALWKALENVNILLKPGGKLFISIYNDQRFISKYWRFVKSLYNRNSFYRLMVITVHSPYLIGIRFLSRVIRGKLGYERGMSLWFDMLDWLGGYPFETAKPEEVTGYYQKMHLFPEKIIQCGRRHGCNEYVFASIQDGKQ